MDKYFAHVSFNNTQGLAVNRYLTLEAETEVKAQEQVKMYVPIECRTPPIVELQPFK